MTLSYKYTIEFNYENEIFIVKARKILNNNL